MKKTLIISLFLLVLSGCTNQQSFGGAGERMDVCYEQYCFNVEIADSDAERAQGLMWRKELSDDEGMLFVFEAAGNHPFWMKNTLIPLDMVWIAQDGTIAHIEEHVPPCISDPCPTYGPSEGVTGIYVLELASGTVAKLDIVKGQKIDISWQ